MNAAAAWAEVVRVPELDVCVAAAPRRFTTPLNIDDFAFCDRSFGGQVDQDQPRRREGVSHTWYRVKEVKCPAYKSPKLLLSFSMYLWPSVYGTNNSSSAVSSRVVIDADITEVWPVAGGETVKVLFMSESAGDRGAKVGSSYTLRSSTSVDVRW